MKKRIRQRRGGKQNSQGKRERVSEEKKLFNTSDLCAKKLKLLLLHADTASDLLLLLLVLLLLLLLCYIFGCTKCVSNQRRERRKTAEYTHINTYKAGYKLISSDINLTARLKVWGRITGADQRTILLNFIFVYASICQQVLYLVMSQYLIQCLAPSLLCLLVIIQQTAFPSLFVLN